MRRAISRSTGGSKYAYTLGSESLEYHIHLKMCLTIKYPKDVIAMVAGILGLPASSFPPAAFFVIKSPDI